MINIKIISVGQLKEQYLRDLILEYKKRISKFANVEEVVLKDESNKMDTNLVIDLESKKILEAMSDNYFHILLDLKGEMLSSEELAKKIDYISTYNSSNIAFVIGGSCGVNNEVRNRSNYRLCFSKMTFPHQLMKGILLEQIYRSFTILNNIKYHK